MEKVDNRFSRWLLVHIRIPPLLVLILHRAAAISQNCLRTSSCSCRYEDGSVVDLKPLSENNDTRRITVVSGNAYVYIWSPCNGFTLGDCQDVAMCQTDSQAHNPPQHYYTLGYQATVSFYHDGSDKLILQYSAIGGDYVTRTVSITLVCDNNIESDFAFLQESPTANYNFELKSKYACAKESGTTVTPTPAPGPEPDPGLDYVYLLLGCILFVLVLMLIVMIVTAVARMDRYMTTPSRAPYQKLGQLHVV